jgi:molecular chaperone HtpG
MNESNSEWIRFQVDLSRIIEVLAKQIYQDPLALLRENTQNAFDAIRLRMATGSKFTPQISIDVTPSSISISDNGIGMTPTDLKEHYWRAGASSKNTAQARAAGVVGTFGIGAMANFGIADELIVETESSITGERTYSSAKRDTLSTTENTIPIRALKPIGAPGTKVTANVPPQQLIDIDAAKNYIVDFVAYIDIPVTLNGQLISQRNITDAVPEVGKSFAARKGYGVSPDFKCDLDLRVTGAGEVWAKVSSIVYGGSEVAGCLILRQSGGAIRSYRNGFGLAAVGVSSTYSLGGIADLTILQPTAGREALTTDSMQLLQSVVTGIDDVISLELSRCPEADSNTQFMEWVRRNGRYDLCGSLLVRVEPDDQRISLGVLKEMSLQKTLLVYSGNDSNIINASATDDSPLIILSSRQPRRTCEDQFLTQYCRIEELADAPTVLAEKDRADWSLAEQALVFRVTSIVASDYFLDADVTLGSLSHGLPIVVERINETVRLVFDPTAATFKVVCELYERDFNAFGSMAKDFVRNIVFPRISNFMPSSTRQGAESFLKSIRRTRDIFEYEYDDLENLHIIWDDYLNGRLTMTQAAARSSRAVSRNVQIVERESTLSVRDVVPDVVDNELATASGPFQPGAAPPILRTDVDSEAKLLVVGESESGVKGFRCFIALSEKVREQRGEFFLQPHSTSVVWGGQKVLFVFEHHSGEFGLYYDLQNGSVVTERSGGGAFPTATMILRNKIMIPLPAPIAAAFIPEANERKRFEVRCDLLYTDKRTRR